MNCEGFAANTRLEFNLEFNRRIQAKFHLGQFLSLP